ncbi:hypothetical protein CEE37_00540 [candidate division LCP-89 bacterium B3_LCP]|uniref:FlgD/Vpr Ig-like domain-containing protein n=1 Tax=candidate division LCP-89 bacterium B3_LCP TaxID=2012998 RepID=A0A532V4V1_UNCL8|nr:MAG: hypothetical protein CEE37_00540 [candidate division LCP-89 bacterium B3_LCP]
MLKTLRIFTICCFAIGILAGFYLIPSDDVNSEPEDSPLFAVSLENTTNYISGKGGTGSSPDGSSGGMTPLVTCEVTCGPTCAQTTCGTTCVETCEFTCSNTCEQATCNSTCLATCQTTCSNTCSQPTCESTCVVTCSYTCEDPITLMSFGVGTSGSDIVVYWTTGSEVDNYRFIVWKSLNPDNGFYAIEEVLSAGNGVTTTSYEFTDNAVQPGITYYYKLSDISIYGYETMHATVASATTGIAIEYCLVDNFPNPFNPVTTIRFYLPETSQTELTIHDMRGRLVNTLVNGVVSGGVMHEVIWNATDDRGTFLPSGMYIYRLTAGDQSASGKMVFMK